MRDHFTSVLIGLLAFSIVLAAPEIHLSLGYAFTPNAEKTEHNMSIGMKSLFPATGIFHFGTESNLFWGNSQKTVLVGLGGYGIVSLHRHFSLDFSISGGMAIHNEKTVPVLSPSAGMRYFFSPRTQAGFLLGWRLFIDSDETQSLLDIAIFWVHRFGFHDADNDWVADGKDKCPGTPKKAIVRSDGCAIDSDGDGVFDGLDNCPNTPLAALVDSLGCPMDADGDGVYDGVDRCPETPSDIPVDTIGCPRDTDRDGVPDYADSCDLTREGAKVDHKGCPVDSDEDGVPDGIDQCNNTPSGFSVDLFGCPTIPTADGEVIYEAFDDALEITASALNQLQRVARRIRAYPDRKTIIKVHTDTEGSPAYNKNRATSVGKKVKDFLVTQGIDAKAIEIIAMGESNPIKDEKTVTDRNMNRRLEFFVE